LADVTRVTFTAATTRKPWVFAADTISASVAGDVFERPTGTSSD
jgi:hypothetical protein